MKAYKYIFIVIAITTCLAAKAQDDFLVGSAKTSIEPPPEIFSVALAGYGAPREGRFSLTWQLISEAPDFTSVTAINNKLYGINKDMLYSGILSGESIKWETFKGANGIKALAGVNNQLYAVKNDNMVYKIKIVNHKLVFTNIGFAENMKSITGLKNDLFGIDEKGNYYKASVLSAKLKWVPLNEGADCNKSHHVKQLSSDDDRLYAINDNDTVYLSEPKSSKLDWRIIGRYNSYTFKIKIKHIVVVAKKLYAFDDENHVYMASHQTKGDLCAQAIAIKKEGKTVLIIGADVAGFDFSFSEKLKQQIRKKTGIPAEAIIVNAAHNHFAPVNHLAWRTWQCFYQKPDEKYVNDVLYKGMLDAAFKALATLEPAKLDFFRGNTNIGINRRAAFYLDAPYDGTLDVLAVKAKDDVIKNLLFVAGCHPVFNNNDKNSTFTLSANYPGVARETVLAGLKNANPFFIQGCGGDINPASGNYEVTGKDLGNDVLQTLKTEPLNIDGPISYSMNMIKIPIKKFTLQEVKSFKKLNEEGLEIEKKFVKPYTPEGQFQLTELMEREKNIRWANMMLGKYASGTVEDYLPLYVQSVTIGDWKFIGLSREVTTEYASAIRNLWPDKKVTVAAYCNDVNSYLPNRWHIMYKTYEGYDSFFWYGRPGIPYPTIFNTVMDGMKKYRDQESNKNVDNIAKDCLQYFSIVIISSLR